MLMISFKFYFHFFMITLLTSENFHCWSDKFNVIIYFMRYFNVVQAILCGLIFDVSLSISCWSSCYWS
jgi:hypothetical protein